MKLEDANRELMDTLEKLTAFLPELQKKEYAYKKRYYDLVLTSQRPSQQLRESEAESILMEDPMYIPYQELKVAIKVLYNRKDFLTEYCKNLRALTVASAD